MIRAAILFREPSAPGQDQFQPLDHGPIRCPDLLGTRKNITGVPRPRQARTALFEVASTTLPRTPLERLLQRLGRGLVGRPRCSRKSAEGKGRRAAPVPAPFGSFEPASPVRSSRCSCVLIPGVILLRRSSWGQGPFPGDRALLARSSSTRPMPLRSPRSQTVHGPVTPHRALRLPTPSLPCSPDALDPRPLARPSSRHDERVLLCPSTLPVPAVDPYNSPSPLPTPRAYRPAPPPPASPSPPAPTGSARSCERAPGNGPSAVDLAPSTVGAGVVPLPVGAPAARTRLPPLVGPSGRLLPTRGSRHRSPAPPLQELPSVSVLVRAAVHVRPGFARIVIYP